MRGRTICKGCLHGIEHHPNKGPCTYGRTTLFGGCRCPAYGTPKSKIPTGPVDPDELEIDKARASLQAELDRFCATMKAIVQRRRQAAAEHDVLPQDIERMEARHRSPVMKHVVEPPKPKPIDTAVGVRKVQDERAASPTLVRKFLLVLAQHRLGCTRKQCLLFAGYRSSGDTSTAFASMLRDGFAETAGDALLITEEGLRALGPYEPLPSGAALRQQILSKAKPFTRAALEELFAMYPQSMTRSEILEATGYRSSGDTSTAFAKMVTLGYAQKTDDGLVAARELFT